MHQRPPRHPHGDPQTPRRTVARRRSLRVPSLVRHNPQRLALGAPLLSPRVVSAAFLRTSGGGGPRRVQAALHGLRQAGAESTRRPGPGQACLDSGRGSALALSVLR